MIVTRAELDALRSRMMAPKADLHLTPGGFVQSTVQTNHFRQQQWLLSSGEHALNTAQQNLRTELAKMRNQGVHRAQFNAKSHTRECNHRW